MLWYKIKFVTRNAQIKDMRGEAQGWTSFSLRLGAFCWVSRVSCDTSDKAGGADAWGKHPECPGSCHRVSLNLTYMEFFVFVNLLNWFEFTKEWLIQNCLWQKNIYIALIVQFRFKHCNGTEKGQKNWSGFSLIILIPRCASSTCSHSCCYTWPLPLLAVLRMNSQAITQYCKVPRDFEGGDAEASTQLRSLSGPAFCPAPQCAWRVRDFLHSDRAVAITCALSHEDVPGGLTRPQKRTLPSPKSRSTLCNSLERLFGKQSPYFCTVLDQMFHL